MSENRDRRKWWLLTGVSAAAGLGAAWAAGMFRPRPPGAVGAHAWVVPTQQARTEARWTRHASVHSSESRHG